MKNCKVCNKRIEAGVTCGRSCHDAWFRVTVECDTCQKSITLLRSKVLQRNYCSERCFEFRPNRGLCICEQCGERKPAVYVLCKSKLCVEWRSAIRKARNSLRGTVRNASQDAWVAKIARARQAIKRRLMSQRKPEVSVSSWTEAIRRSRKNFSSDVKRKGNGEWYHKIRSTWNNLRRRARSGAYPVSRN